MERVRLAQVPNRAGDQERGDRQPEMVRDADKVIVVRLIVRYDADVVILVGPEEG